MEKLKLAESREGIIFENGAFHTEQRTVSRELVWKLLVNDRPLGSFACSPLDMEEAAVGYLFLNGAISAPEDILKLDIREESGEILAHTAQFSPAVRPDVKKLEVTPEEVFTLIARLESLRTKGVHSCALVQGDDFVFRQDVSRSTSFDKAAGSCLLRHISTEESIMVFSGRVPLSLAEKAAKMGCGLILACSGPTNAACELAEKLGITIVGLAGNGRFCIYTCPERIKA